MVSIYVYGECIVRISLLSAKLSNSYVCSGYKTREIQSVFGTCSIVGLRPHWVTTNYMEQYNMCVVYETFGFRVYFIYVCFVVVLLGNGNSFYVNF